MARKPKLKPSPPLRHLFTDEQREAAQQWLLAYRTLGLPTSLTHPEKSFDYMTTRLYLEARAEIEAIIDRCRNRASEELEIPSRSERVWLTLDHALQVYVAQCARPTDLVAVRKSFEAIEQAAREFYLLLHGEGIHGGEVSELWNFLRKTFTGEVWQLSPLPDREGLASRERHFRDTASREALSTSMKTLGDAARLAAALMPQRKHANWHVRDLGRRLAFIFENLTGQLPSVRHAKADDSGDSEFEKFILNATRLMPPEYLATIGSIREIADNARNDWKRQRARGGN